MRLYAVLTPPEHVVDDLARAVGDARERAPHLPWTEPEMWSLRLARLGSLGLTEMTIVRNALTEIGTWCPPLRLWLTGAEGRPDAEEADEVQVGLGGQVDDVWSLARAIPSVVQRHGLFLDRRSFRPAINVAEGGRQAVDALQAVRALGGYRGPAWTATEMRLVRLVPNQPGAPGIGRYEDMARYAFSAPAESDDEDGGRHRADQDDPLPAGRA